MYVCIQDWLCYLPRGSETYRVSCEDSAPVASRKVATIRSGSAVAGGGGGAPFGTSRPFKLGSMSRPAGAGSLVRCSDAAVQPASLTSLTAAKRTSYVVGTIDRRCASQVSCPYSY